MIDSEFFVCRQCGNEHEATTQEVASFLYCNQRKPKEILKILDYVSLKYSTELNNLSKTQELKKLNGAKDEF